MKVLLIMTRILHLAVQGDVCYLLASCELLHGRAKIDAVKKSLENLACLTHQCPV